MFRLVTTSSCTPGSPQVLMKQSPSSRGSGPISPRCVLSASSHLPNVSLACLNLICTLGPSRDNIRRGYAGIADGRVAEAVQVQQAHNFHVPVEQLCVVSCRFLGKVLSQYISVCVSEGRGDGGLISAGFNYDRWKKTYSKTKPVSRGTKVLSPPSSLPSSLYVLLASSRAPLTLQWQRYIPSLQRSTVRPSCLLPRPAGAEVVFHSGPPSTLHHQSQTAARTQGKIILVALQSSNFSCTWMRSAFLRRHRACSSSPCY